jgi:hypothetical protein
MKEEVVAIDHSTLNILPMCQPMVNHQWSMFNHQWSMANASSFLLQE